MENSQKNNRKLLIIIIVALAILAGIITLIVMAVQYNQTTEIELLVVPTSATTTIDGKEYKNGTYRLSKGEHTIKITKEDFTPKEFTFNTNDTSKVYAYLEQSDGSMSWYLNHEDDALLLSQIGSYEAGIEETKYAEENPIITKFPIVYANYDENLNYTEYRIDAGSFAKCKSDFCIKITDTTGNNFDAAKNLLKENDINPENYEIIYEYTPITELD